VGWGFAELDSKIVTNADKKKKGMMPKIINISG